MNPARLLPLLALAAPATGAAEAAHSAVAPVSPVSGANVAQVVLALFLVLGAIGLVAWLIRRMGGWHGGPSGSLRVVGGISVGQRERVLLVQVGERQLLLGVAPGRINTLHVLETPVVVESVRNAGGGERFAERLAAAMKRGREKSQ